MRSLRRLAAVLLLVAVVATLLPAPLGAQVAVFDPANFAQQVQQYVQMLIDYALQIETLLQEIEQLVQLVEQVEMMVQNLERLDEVARDNPGRALADLRHLLHSLEGVLYSTVDLLPRYDELYTPGVAEELPHEEAERLSQTLGTFRSLLAGAQASAGHSEQSAAVLGHLSLQLEGAEGNLQALQAVGALTTQVATEVTRLSEMNAMTLNALAVQASHELAAREEARLTFLDWVHQGRITRGRGSGTFQVVPGEFRRER